MNEQILTFAQNQTNIIVSVSPSRHGPGRRFSWHPQLLSLLKCACGFEGVIYQGGVVQEKGKKHRGKMGKPGAGLVHVPHRPRRGNQSTRDRCRCGFRGWLSITAQAATLTGRDGTELIGHLAHLLPHLTHCGSGKLQSLNIWPGFPASC